MKEIEKNRDLNKKGSVKPNKLFELLISNDCSRKNSQLSEPVIEEKISWLKEPNKSMKSYMVTSVSGVYKSLKNSKFFRQEQ